MDDGTSNSETSDARMNRGDLVSQSLASLENKFEFTTTEIGTSKGSHSAMKEDTTPNDQSSLNNPSTSSLSRAESVSPSTSSEDECQSSASPIRELLDETNEIAERATERVEEEIRNEVSDVDLIQGEERKEELDRSESKLDVDEISVGEVGDDSKEGAKFEEDVVGGKLSHRAKEFSPQEDRGMLNGLLHKTKYLMLTL